jgi:DNA-binding NarL/FixJ family response regulator
MNPIRVLIADDHAIVRAGLRQLFALAPDIQVVGEADRGANVIEALREQAVDLLLLDMTMPGITGEDLIARLRAHHPQLPILVLSMHDEPQVALRALRAGAGGYLAKDKDAQTLLAAVRRVAGGGNFVDPTVAERMALEVSGLAPRRKHDQLSDRESQVLRLLASGLSVNEIAARLSISNKTVSTHKARLMERMGFASNAELVRYAVANGLVD